MKQPSLKSRIENFNNLYIHNYQDAHKIIYIYNRLCYLSARVCEMQNLRDYDGSAYLKEQEAREEKHINRLNKYLDKYNMVLEFPGIYPIICHKRDEDGRPGEHTYMF